MHKAIFLGTASLMATGVIGASRADDFTGENPAVQTADRLEWAWDGGDRLGVAVPGTVHYQASGTPRVIVRGPADLLSRVRYDHGELRMEDGWFRFGSNEKLDVTVSGTALHEIGVAGSGNVELGDIHQDRMELHIAGSGSVTGSGRADTLSLHISGSGNGHLEKLASADFTAHISGSGNVDVASADRADVAISGSGKVRFAAAMPKEISTHISGSGKVTDADGREISSRNVRLREDRTR